MPATPGTRLNVLSAGLHQLDVKCQTLAGQLTAVVPAPSVATSTWQSNAAVVAAAQAASVEDLEALAGRVRSRGGSYSTSGARYTANEQDAARAFTRVLEV